MRSPRRRRHHGPAAGTRPGRQPWSIFHALAGLRSGRCAWGLGSAGRASAWHAEGRRFETARLHKKRGSGERGGGLLRGRARLRMSSRSTSTPRVRGHLLPTELGRLSTGVKTRGSSVRSRGWARRRRYGQGTIPAGGSFDTGQRSSQECAPDSQSGNRGFIHIQSGLLARSSPHWAGTVTAGACLDVAGSILVGSPMGVRLTASPGVLATEMRVRPLHSQLVALLPQLEEGAGPNPARSRFDSEAGHHAAVAHQVERRPGTTEAPSSNLGGGSRFVVVLRWGSQPRPGSCGFDSRSGYAWGCSSEGKSGALATRRTGFDSPQLHKVIVGQGSLFAGSRWFPICTWCTWCAGGATAITATPP